MCEPGWIPKSATKTCVCRLHSQMLFISAAIEVRNQVIVRDLNPSPQNFSSESPQVTVRVWKIEVLFLILVGHSVGHHCKPSAITFSDGSIDRTLIRMQHVIENCEIVWITYNPRFGWENAKNYVVVWKCAVGWLIAQFWTASLAKHCALSALNHDWRPRKI